MRKKLLTVLIWVVAWVGPLLAIYAALISGALHKPGQWWRFAFSLAVGFLSIGDVRAIFGLPPKKT
jgi:hypothetical protein